MIGQREREAFYKVAGFRRSVRDFKPDEIPDEVLGRILETGRRAASAANRQPWCFVVARRSQGHGLFNLVHGRGFQDAPILLVGLAVREQAWVRKSDGVNYAWVDTTIALTEMILAATAEGLGSCWIAAFDDAEARRCLGLPRGIDPVAMVALGYPARPLGPVEKDRRPMEDVVRQGIWTP